MMYLFLFAYPFVLGVLFTITATYFVKVGATAKDGLNFGLVLSAVGYCLYQIIFK